jgi:hypothetical protein
VEQIKNACVHYESKCRLNDKKASRYLLDLSKEVQDQLDQLCQNTGRQQKERETLIGKLKQFEQMCATSQGDTLASTLSTVVGGDETGKDADGAGGGSVSHDLPTLLNKALSHTLEQQERIKSLEKELKDVKHSNAASEKQLHQALSDHVAASRDSMRAEEMRISAERDAALRQQQSRHNALVTEYKLGQATEGAQAADKIRSEFENESAQYRHQIDNLIKQQQQAAETHRRESAGANETWRQVWHTVLAHCVFYCRFSIYTVLIHCVSYCSN